MEEKGFNQIRLIVALIGFAMLIFLGLSAAIPVVDLCLIGIGFAAVVLLSRNWSSIPWAVGFTVFYMMFPILGYHFPLLVWEAPNFNAFENIALYGNKLAILLVNAFLYFLAVVALIFFVAAVFSGFSKFSREDSSSK